MTSEMTDEEIHPLAVRERNPCHAAVPARLSKYTVGMGGSSDFGLDVASRTPLT